MHLSLSVLAPAYNAPQLTHRRNLLWRIGLPTGLALADTCFAFATVKSECHNKESNTQNKTGGEGCVRRVRTHNYIKSSLITV